jgi:hypothetical protein
MPSWTLYLNAALGSLVVAVGAWLAWNGLSPHSAAGVSIAAAAFLWWRGTTLTLIWAWSTLWLGLECFAWPIVTMLQIHSAGGEPSDAEMGAILSATLMGVFSACFWLVFSYGLFKRAKEGPGASRREKSFAPANKTNGSARASKKR